MQSMYHGQCASTVLQANYAAKPYELEARCCCLRHTYGKYLLLGACDVLMTADHGVLVSMQHMPSSKDDLPRVLTGKQLQEQYQEPLQQQQKQQQQERYRSDVFGMRTAAPAVLYTGTECPSGQQHLTQQDSPAAASHISNAAS